MSASTLPSLSRFGGLDGAFTTTSQSIRDISEQRIRLTRSSIDILSVMSYAPAHGKEGSPIFVNFTCKADMGAIGVHIRLVIGRRAVSTQVREMPPTGYGRWQLEGSAPSFSKQRSPSATVPLTIQAVDRENKILDSVTFGDFTYKDTDRDDTSGQLDLSRRPRTFSSSSNTRPSVTVLIPSGTDSSDRAFKRQSPYSRPPTPASSDSEPVSSSQSRKSSGRFHSQSSTTTNTTQGGLRRTRPISGFSDDNTQSAALDIMTPLDNLCYNWDESELQAGRRLVRFWRVQDGNRLMISAEPISQADYDPNDIVISCIYREETDACCVTSVDIIHLLQRLVDADFEVDEKNRIRRNLEGLRPTTVSKTRPGFEFFFQRIMDFPDPKPRKIEKDLKVFDWKLLPQALEKIVSKYSMSISASTPVKEEDPAASELLSATTTSSKHTALESPAEYVSSYDDSPVQSTGHDAQLQTAQLSHLSPVVELIQMPGTSPEATPDNPMFPSAVGGGEPMQILYVDATLMNRYSDPNMTYGVVSSTIPSHMYTMDSSMTLANEITPAHTYLGDQARNEWDVQAHPDIVVSGLPVPVPEHAACTTTATVTSARSMTQHFPLHTYDDSTHVQPDSQESIDIYAVAPQYTMNTFDSFEFQTLREHNVNVLAPAGQVA